MRNLSRKRRFTTARGFSLLEMLAAIVIIGILGAMIIPRIGGQTAMAKRNVCHQYRSDLNSAIEHFYFERGTFPTTLDELFPEYYPEEIPQCPVLNQPYEMDPTTGRIIGHDHS